MHLSERTRPADKIGSRKLGACVLFTCFIVLSACVLAKGADEGPLVDASRDIDIVSPLGVETSLCGIRPALSRAAAEQVRVVFGDVCRFKSSSAAISVWIADSIPVDDSLADAISRGADFHHVALPLAPKIAQWFRDKGVPAPPPISSLVIASVSAVNYEAGWLIPFVHTHRMQFYGRSRTVTRDFLLGTNGGWVDRSSGCERVVIPLSDRGYVALALARNDPKSALACVARVVSGVGRSSVQVSLPKLTLVTTSCLAVRLRQMGLRSLFDGRSNPFPTLMPGVGVSDVLQAIAFRLDEAGVSVKAGTNTVIARGMGHPTERVSFDHPFALAVFDPTGSPVLIGSIENLGE
jgi:hypothetical protein